MITEMGIRGAAYSNREINLTKSSFGILINKQKANVERVLRVKAYHMLYE